MEKTYNICSFFAGVGGIDLGFQQTGNFRIVYANELDKYAQITYSFNNPLTYLDCRNICNVGADELPVADVFIGGFPCQAFSIAGYGKGFNDARGNLFFELLRLIKAKRPRVVFVENVKNLVTHDNGKTFKVIREALVIAGYYLKWCVLNGKTDGNVPQNRERIYLIAFKFENDFNNFAFPRHQPLTKKLSDVIDFKNKKEEKYYYRKGKQSFYKALAAGVTSKETAYQWRRKYVRANKAHVLPTLTANMGVGGNNVPIVLTDSGEIRKLTPEECFKAQGFPNEFKLPAKISDSQFYKQAGNSVIVPVIKKIAKGIFNSIDGHAGVSKPRGGGENTP